MGKLTNSVAKGMKIAGQVALGCFVYGAVTGIANFHPNPTTVPGFLWYAGGSTLATGAIAFIGRWTNYNPAKVQ